MKANTSNKNHFKSNFQVEPDFLISFLNSSIESLEKSTESEINGIMPKEELLERLREKKMSMEKLYLVIFKEIFSQFSSLITNILNF